MATNKSTKKSGIISALPQSDLYQNTQINKRDAYRFLRCLGIISSTPVTYAIWRMLQKLIPVLDV